MLAFFRAVLDGEEPPGPRVLAFVLGARRWLELESWPPADASPASLPLAGSGSLAVDPAVLPPAVGGRRLQGGTPGGGFGPRDQRALLSHPGVARLDVRLERDVLAAGPASALLHVSVDGAGERQWVAILCQEHPDGFLQNLAEGVALAPADASEVRVELGDVCVELPAGTRLVLLVAGGLRPRFPAPLSRATQYLRRGSELELTTCDTI
jgi:uncharacterized protein